VAKIVNNINFFKGGGYTENDKVPYKFHTSRRVIIAR